MHERLAPSRRTLARSALIFNVFSAEHVWHAELDVLRRDHTT
ncbi:MAG: hypothetical protein JWN04_5031 [Myxococcaceae bacterium]|nr:hypothetical protein [Myxococcaceae bacterium]